MNEIQKYIQEISLDAKLVGSDDFYKEHGGMVYTVFSDGEVSLQKAGSLLWQRSLHLIIPGHPTAKLPADWFPNTINGHPFVFCSEHKQALDLYQMISRHFQ